MAGRLDDLTVRRTLRVALIVPTLSGELRCNLEGILRQVSDAAQGGAQLVLLPEATLTGLINDDDPAYDLPLGQPLDGAILRSFADAARRYRVWLGLGFLERGNGPEQRAQLYDAAALYAPDGRLALHYRRMQPNWTSPNVDRRSYGLGERVESCDTVFGRVAFLICGDLFDDAIVAQAKAARLDLLLFPFARCFSEGDYDQSRWDRQEAPEYARRAALIGAPALMVNSVSPRELMGGTFGGAMVVGRTGEILATLPLGGEGVLLYDLNL